MSITPKLETALGYSLSAHFGGRKFQFVPSLVATNIVTAKDIIGNDSSIALSGTHTAGPDLQ